MTGVVLFVASVGFDGGIRLDHHGIGPVAGYYGLDGSRPVIGLFEALFLY